MTPHIKNCLFVDAIFELHAILDQMNFNEMNFEQAILFEHLFNIKKYHLCQLFLQTKYKA